MQKRQDVQNARDALKKALPNGFFSARPPVAVILGTGLFGAIAEDFQILARVPFRDVPGFPIPGASSHKGEFIAAKCADLPVLVQSGRVHLYEGGSPAEITMGVALMAELGCASLIVTNAAGALNPLFPVPGLMRICDIINFTGASPLTGENDQPGRSRFADMSEPFDRVLGEIADARALALGIPLARGVYIGVRGPEMETPAETRMYRQWGADAIGMSTALEVIAARYLGLRCLAISCLTNKNLPDCMEPAPIESVIANAAKASQSLARLLGEVLQEIARA